MTDKEVMQMALDVLIDIEMSYECEKEIESLRIALAQPEQEPVAWMYSTTGTLFDTCPQDADEGEFLPLYTSPPQREWVVLTDEEISEIWSIIEMQNDDMHELKKFARAIEAKLKEKNT